MNEDETVMKAAGHRIMILYFAWVREIVGMEQEFYDLPADVSDLRGLMAILARRNAAFLEIFSKPEQLRMAVNNEYCGPEAAVGPGDEIAFFPPVTGG